ncbi:MAG: peptidase S1, partial [Terriglobales bacterium]
MSSTLLVVLTLAVGILIGSVISIGVKGKEAQKPGEMATPLTVPPLQQGSPSAFAQIAKQIEPSVVNINTESQV